MQQRRASVASRGADLHDRCPIVGREPLGRRRQLGRHWWWRRRRHERAAAPLEPLEPHRSAALGDPRQLRLDLLPAAHEVDQPQPQRRRRVERVARAEGAIARRRGEPAARGDAHHARQHAAAHLGEAKGGVGVREHDP